jgi:hypothetical protein
MQIEEAINLIRRHIETNETHQDYHRVVDVSETYRIFITGKGISKKLINFVQREDVAAFAQRIALTRSITPATAASIRQPFNKVVRNDRIRKDVKLKTENRKQILDKMILSFYGSARKKSRGLDYWMKTRFVEMQFIDPNAWVVVEWDAPDSLSEVVQVRPFEVSASQAVNFFIVNDEVRWLMVKQGIKYNTTTPAGTGGTGTSNAMVPDNPASNALRPIKKEGIRWTLYDEDVTIVFEQYDPAWLKQSGYMLQPNESYVKVNDVDYIQRTYEPKIGYVPAFRIGYKRDDETDGRTFVNPWHDALCFFEKSLKAVSELDLTMTLHVFPQKIQYVQKCKGVPAGHGQPRKSCNSGYLQGTQEKCPSCKGDGFKLHTTAQDAILLPMPDTPQEMVNLEGVLVYKAPPIDLVKFQNEYVLQLERQAHQAVFNSQVFVRKSGGGVDIATTATQQDYNYQSVYDTLEPFTEKYSETWRELVTIMAVIAAEDLDTIEVTHEFPADYKLKTGNVLLAERKTAQESGAPAFMIEALDDDLATVVHAGDALALQKYRVMKRYNPFPGKSEEEVALALASELVREEDKILYLNFGLIFRELEREDPAFWFMKDLAAQKERVDGMVEEWKAEIDEAKPKLPAFGSFRPGVTEPPDDEGTDEGSEGNPGSNNSNPE